MNRLRSIGVVTVMLGALWWWFAARGEIGSIPSVVADQPHETVMAERRAESGLRESSRTPASVGVVARTRSVIVTVVDRRGDRAVSGVDVVAREVAGGTSRELARSRTDERGIATLEVPEGATTVGIDSVHWIGAASLQDSVESLELKAAAMLEVFVRAVDEAGRPLAGFPVRLSSTNESTGEQTDEEGVARFWLMAPEVQTAWLATPSEWVGAAPVGTVVDRPTTRIDPAVLVVRTFGLVRIRLVTPSGESLPRDARVRLMPHGADSAALSATQHSRSTRPRDGQVLFPRVALGQQLDVSVEGYGRSEEYTLSGPLRAGETIDAEFVLPAPGLSHAIILRPIGQAGETMQGMSVRATLHFERDSIRSNGSIDDEGLLRLPFDASGLRSAHLLRLELRTSGPGNDAAQQFAELVVGRVVEGDLDLGEVAFQSVPELMRGSVVGPDGTAMAGVEVRILRTLDGGSVPTHAYAVSDANGQFRIVAAPTEALRNAKALALRATIEGWLPTIIEAVKLGTNVRLLMQQGGEVVARLIDPGLADELDLKLELLDGEGRVLDVPRHVATDGTTRWVQVPPGSIRCELRAGRREAPIVHVNGVVVSAGEVTRDPRMASIRVADHVELSVVNVLDPDGRPLPGAMVWRMVDGGGSGRRTDPAGRVRFTQRVDGQPLQILVQSVGMRTHYQPGVRGDLHVRLQRESTLRLRIADLPPGLDAARLSLASDGSPYPMATTLTMKPSAAGEIEIPLPPACSVEIHAWWQPSSGRPIQLGALPDPLVFPLEQDAQVMPIRLGDALRAKLVEAASR